MVSDYNSNYPQGPEVGYPEKKRRKSDRNKKKIIIILIILAIFIASVGIAVTVLTPQKPQPQENLSWFYEMQEQEKNKLANTESRVYDLSNQSAAMKPLNKTVDNNTVYLLYDNNITYMFNPSLDDFYYLKMSNIKPVTTIQMEYDVENITYKKYVLYDSTEKIAGGFINIDKHKEVTVTIPDPEAQFKIVIKDTDGNVILTDGYNIGSDSSKKQTITLYEGGDYNVEFSGSRIGVNLKIYQRF